MIRKTRPQDGFTIVELLIATTAFSIILIVIVYAVLFISHNFIRGTVESQTQENARSIMQQVTEQIQLSDGNISQGDGYPATNTDFICVGDTQYSYVLNQEVDGSASPASGTVPHALVARQLPGCDSSSVAENISTANLPEGSTELLGNHMRLGEFEIGPVNGSTSLFSVSIIIGYGDQDGGGQSGALIIANSEQPYQYSCIPSIIKGDFCATATLSSIVQQRIGSGD